MNISRLLLQRAGINITRPRLAILDLLKRSRKPRTALSIASATKRVDQATVYRTLELFEERGIVRRVGLRQNGASFEFVSKERHHHHLICERCGRIEDIEGCGIEYLLRATAKKPGFSKLTGHIVEIYGVCRDCTSG